MHSPMPKEHQAIAAEQLAFVKQHRSDMTGRERSVCRRGQFLTRPVTYWSQNDADIFDHDVYGSMKRRGVGKEAANG